MAIDKLTKAGFDALDVGERCHSLWTAKTELAWFSTEDAQVAGLIHRDPRSALFGYSVCVLGDDGGYYRVALGADIPNQGWAARLLREAMASYEGTALVPDRPA